MKAVITTDNRLQVLEFIKKFLLENKADHIVINENTISYKGSTSNWRGSLFGSVDSGVFTLNSEQNILSLNYEIYTKQLFVTAIILSVCMGVFMKSIDGPWWFGIIVFIWLFGVNWLIIQTRHSSAISRIAYGINEIFCTKDNLM